jgi:hypothetical protein
MGIAIADKPSAFRRLEDRSFEDPVVFVRTAKGKHWRSHNPLTAVFIGESQQISVRDIARFRSNTAVLKLARLPHSFGIRHLYGPL